MPWRITERGKTAIRARRPKRRHKRCALQGVAVNIGRVLRHPGQRWQRCGARLGSGRIERTPAIR
jgi:hypothetical protein